MGPWYRRYNRRAMWFQFGVYLFLPYLSIFRALLAYSWFWDAAGQTVTHRNSFRVFHIGYMLCVAGHVWWRFPELVRTAEELLAEPPVLNDVDRNALRKSKPHTSAGTALHTADFHMLLQ